MSDSDNDFAKLTGLVCSDNPIEVGLAQDRALQLMGQLPKARILAAKAYDRMRAFGGRAQKFGTQAVLVAGERVLWPVDSGATDSERAKWGLESLANLRKAAVHAPLIGKATLRDILRARRDKLTEDALASCSGRILDHGCAVLSSTSSDVVAAYWPLPGEADPRPLAKLLSERDGARLALPVVAGKDMKFREWKIGARLQPAGFGSFGPDESAPEVMPSIVLTPLLGFDRQGGRLGQGKGYYDRKLSASLGKPSPLVVGVASSCQQLPVVPTECHDRRLDLLISEVESIDFRG